MCTQGLKELDASDEAYEGERVGEGSDGSTCGGCVCILCRCVVKEFDPDTADGVAVVAVDSGERELTSERVMKGWMHGIENGCEYDVGRQGNSDGGRDVPFMGSSRICVIIVAGDGFQPGLAVRGRTAERNSCVDTGVQEMVLQSRDVGMWRYGCGRRTSRSSGEFDEG